MWTERLAGNVLQRAIQAGVWLRGRKADTTTDWAVGPVGEERIGPGIYQRCAIAEGLRINEAPDAGLVVDFSVMDGPNFSAAELHPSIREFYEHTANWAMDVDVRWKGPLKYCAQTLLYLVSRLMEQMNVPIRRADVRAGINSRVIPMETAAGERRYTGWLRQFKDSGAVIYAGFYATADTPNTPSPCVKVSFPLPSGCTTVILRPYNMAGGRLRLASSGRRFGDPGAYRMHRRNDEVRIAYVPLHERLDLWTDDDGETVRCNHHFSLWRFEFLVLKYHMRRVVSAS